MKMDQKLSASEPLDPYKGLCPWTPLARPLANPGSATVQKFWTDTSQWASNSTQFVMSQYIYGYYVCPELSY